MFGTIRKHQKWLWIVIITLTVISFVIYFSPYSKVNSGRNRVSLGTIDGRKVTEQDYINARRETELHTLLTTGRWADEDRRRTENEIEREVYQWLLLTQKQEDYGIYVGQDVAAQMGRNLLRPFERMGISSPGMFIQKVLNPRGYGVDDFERYIRHFVGLQELINTVGLNGRLITPQEAQGMYERDHQDLSTTAAFFSVSNYLPKVEVTPAALAQFYSNRVVNYVIPERVQVNYVKFAVSNFLGEAEAQLGTNITEIVEANYQRLGTNLATVLPDAKTPEQAKAKIKEQILRNQAMNDAKRRALDFANALFDLKPTRPENLDVMAATNGLRVVVSMPFDRDNGPSDLEVAPDFSKAAFALNSDEPFGGPVAGQDGVYVFSLNKKLPRETPPLDQVRERVTADYKRTQAMSLARQAGYAFAQTATNGLAQGKSFAALCAEAGIKATQLSPFSMTSRSVPELDDPANLSALKEAAFGTTPGKASQFQPTGDGGLVVYVSAKLPLDKSKMDSDMPAYLTSLRRTRQQEAFDQWFRREAEKGLRDTPVGKPQPAPTVSSSTAKS